jgi:DNA invertase Pin-like site-specific DNA recombinase
MERSSKIRDTHLNRKACIYVRQSSWYQVEHHRQSRQRQYDLAEQAIELGWSRPQIEVVDEDQGQSGTRAHARSGFGRMVTAVGMGEVGIVMSLEASRLARNSPDWHNLIYMSRYTDTLIADENGIYDPSDAMDRAMLGMRGQFSELEIDTSIQRMVECRWKKAERGEYLIYPPAGYDLDELYQIMITSDESVRQAIETVFCKFDELGTVRRVLTWWQEQGLGFPVRRYELRSKPVVWINPPVYRMFLDTLHNPIYGGAYAFGRSKTVYKVDPSNPDKLIIKRQQRVPREQWPVLILDHHSGYIDWQTYEDNQQRIWNNRQMKRKYEGVAGPAREGWALLQGLVRCGSCGRPMYVNYGGSRPSPKSTRTLQYRCSSARNRYAKAECQVVGGKQINDVVVEVFLEVTKDAGPLAARLASETLSEQAEASRKLWQKQVEKAEYDAERAFRQYDAAEPENRLVSRTLEARWNECLERLETLRSEEKKHEQTIRPLTEKEKQRAYQLGDDLRAVWDAETTTNQDRKQLLRSLIEEVQLRKEQEHYEVKIIWKGGAVTERRVVRRRRGENVFMTPEDTVEMVRKLATEFDDAQIARVLNKQGRRTGKGNSFTAQYVAQLRNRHGIAVFPRHKARDPKEGPFTADEAAAELGVSSAAVHCWLREGLLPGKQLAPGAPWQIVITDEIRKKLTGGDVPAGWVGLTEAARRLGLPKQQVSYLVKSGKLKAVRVHVGKRSCWKIDVTSATCGKQTELFETTDPSIHKEA